jgi:hypothetical protein
VASNARVRIGSSYISGGAYSTIVDDATSSTEHIVTVSGLTADTKYFYSIGTSSTVLQAGSDNFFTTLPTSTPGRKLRFIAFGDCGRNSTTYQDQSLTQYTSYLTANSIDAPDGWLLLGDNAYNNGTDAQYTSNFFGIYGGSILKNHKLYPVPGNHDYDNNTTNQDTHSVPYYSIFDIPKSGEAGGVASNKEEFYSYDIGNVHFLALDAYGEESNLRLYDTTGAQAVWIKSDLAANAFTGKWIIAYWHHPPYTMGSHNSDSESELINMRENFIRILERYGVDLIINGHSHDYERSLLMKKYYKVNPGDAQLNETNFVSATYNVSTSLATYSSASTCPYATNSTASNKGTVYVVAGSTGASGSTQAGYPHNALPQSVNDGGVFYFEVDGNRLDAKFIQRTGAIFDKFTIVRDVNKTTNYTILNGSSQTLAASWPQSGNYTWTGVSGTTKSLSVTPPNNATTNYSVTDAFGCVTDQFSVTTSSTLPVSGINFTAKLSGNKVNLNWSTESEENSKDFTIERSANGTDFKTIGNVSAAGNATTFQRYSFVDKDPLQGIDYYRLILSNMDEHKEYLGVRKIEYNQDKLFSVKAKTAPGRLVLQINSSAKGLYHIRVVDIAGRERKSETINILSEQVTEEINLSPGVYVWEVKDNKGISTSQKVIIQ